MSSAADRIALSPAKHQPLHETAALAYFSTEPASSEVTVTGQSSSVPITATATATTTVTDPMLAALSTAAALAAASTTPTANNSTGPRQEALIDANSTGARSRGIGLPTAIPLSGASAETTSSTTAAPTLNEVSSANDGSSHEPPVIVKNGSSLVESISSSSSLPTNPATATATATTAKIRPKPQHTSNPSPPAPVSGYKHNPLLLAPATSTPLSHLQHHHPQISSSLSMAPLPPPPTISMYPFHPSQPMVPPMFLNQKLRRGKWSVEEEMYASALIEIFQSGHAIVNEKNGMTLRAFLSRKLHCAPMRISKKYKHKQVGKLVFTNKPGSVPAMPQDKLNECLAKLGETEVKFYRKIFPNYKGQYVLANGGLIVPGTGSAPKGMPLPPLKVKVPLAPVPHTKAPLPPLQPTFPGYGQPQPLQAQSIHSMLPFAPLHLSQCQGKPHVNQHVPQETTSQFKLPLIAPKVSANDQIPVDPAMSQKLPIAVADRTSDCVNVCGQNAISSSGAMKDKSAVPPTISSISSESSKSTSHSRSSATVHEDLSDNRKSCSESTQDAYDQSFDQHCSQNPIENPKKSTSSDSSSAEGLPDFLAGFDKEGQPRTSGDQDREENQHFSPTFTSRSFDDFHKLLGKNISPLTKSEKVFELNPDNEMPSIPFPTLHNVFFPNQRDEYIAPEAVRLPTKRIPETPNKSIKPLPRSSPSFSIGPPGDSQASKSQDNHASCQGWPSDHEERVDSATNNTGSTRLDTSILHAHQSALEAQQRSDHHATQCKIDDAQRGIMALEGQISFPHLTSGSFNRHMEYQHRISRMRPQPSSSHPTSNTVSEPSHTSSDFGTEDEANSSNLNLLTHVSGSHYDASNNSTTDDSNVNDDSDGSGGENPNRRKRHHINSEAVEDQSGTHRGIEDPKLRD